MNRWASARFVLGLLQMFGAVFSATLILRSGLTLMAVMAAFATGLLTLLSVGLFGGMISGMLRKRHSKDSVERKA